MTQLVKLQERLEAIRAAGYDLLAISYDSEAELAAFAETHGIEFPLLSDLGSKVIAEFGILNTLIEPSEERYYGIPFPGAYVLDALGRVEEKFFNRHYATRTSAGTLLSEVSGDLGGLLAGESAPKAAAQGRGITATAFLADSELQMEVASTLWVRLQLDEGLYIYTDPLPDGFIATTVQVLPSEGPAVRSRGVPGSSDQGVSGPRRDPARLSRRGRLQGSREGDGGASWLRRRDQDEWISRHRASQLPDVLSDLLLYAAELRSVSRAAGGASRFSTALVPSCQT